MKSFLEELVDFLLKYVSISILCIFYQFIYFLEIQIMSTVFRKGIHVTMCLWKSNKILRTQKTVCIAVKDRFYSNVNQVENKVAVNQKTDWNKIISEAKKIVGYSTFSLDDEIANATLHLRKLVKSSSHVLKIAE